MRALRRGAVGVRPAPQEMHPLAHETTPRKRTVLGWGSLLALVLVVCLALRLASLQSFLTIDEQLWALRARRFAQALQTGNLAETYQAQHPGVLTMWLGAASLALGMAGEGSDLAGIVFGARWLTALVNWAGVCLMCLLAVRLFGRSVGLVAAVLMGLDPFYLAHSRLLHLDALLTTFMTLSLLGLLLHLRDPRPDMRWLLLSALCTGMALLCKSPSFLLLPCGGLLIVAWSPCRRPRLRTGSHLVLWGAVALLVAFALWPALWVAPRATLTQVWQGILEQGLAPHENENFFLGHPTADPGPLFYPLAWLFRTTPWTLLGLAISPLSFLPSLHASRRGEGRMLGTLWGFILLFSFLMTLGAKKFDRYLLPIFPLADLLAACGLVWLGRRLALFRKPRYRPLGLAIVGVAQLGQVLSGYPYYLSYYNPLAGGARLATKTLLVGRGEGMEQAAAYLNSKSDASRLRVTAWYQSPLAPFFDGESSVLAEADYSTDYFILYINERQREPARAERYCQPQGPEQVIRAKGIDYAWICSTDRARQPLIEYLQEHAEPQDVILLSRPARRLEAALPGQVLAAEDDPLPTLHSLEQAAGTLWYVREPYERVPLRVLDQQLDAHCRRLGEIELPLAQVVRYELPPLSPCAPVQLDQSPNVAFGQEFYLLSAGLATTQLEFRQQVGVTLVWHSSGDLERDLKVAWRVRDEQRRSWSGLDRLLVDDQGEKTSQWRLGTRHVTRHVIPLLPGLPPGHYHLSLVVYHEPTMQQLPHQVAGGPGQHLPYALADIEVVPCPIPPTLDELAIPQPRREPLIRGLILLGLSPWPERVRPGDTLVSELFWEVGGERGEDCAVQLRLQDAAGEVAALSTSAIAGPNYPLSHWPVGERIRARYGLAIPASTRPGAYGLHLSLVDMATDQPLLPEWIPLGEVVVQGREHRFLPPEMEHRQRAFLGQRVALLGYDLPTTQLSPGEELELTLYWQAQEEMSTSYTVFVHLLDDAEQIRGQKDSLPGEGAWPTTSWVAGEVLADHYTFRVRRDALPGQYRLEVGMYDAATGGRLAVLDAQGKRVWGDRVVLDTPVTVR